MRRIQWDAPIIRSSRRALRDTSALVLPGRARHGTTHGYGLGCRCDACTDACTTAGRRYRARLRGELDPLPAPSGRAHGTISRYVNDRCRCDECRRVARDKRAAQRRAARARQDRAGRPIAPCVFCDEEILLGWHGNGHASHERACERRRRAA